MKSACELFRERLVDLGQDPTVRVNPREILQDFDELHQSCRENTGEKCRSNIKQTNKVFICEDIDERGMPIPNSGCGVIDSVIFDGYSFGERMLEGVLFRAYIENDEVKVEPVRKNEDKYEKIVWNNDPYLRQLNEGFWMTKAIDYARRNDVASCCLCGEDVYAQPVSR